jgi:hypothetical protein
LLPFPPLSPPPFSDDAAAEAAVGVEVGEADAVEYIEWMPLGTGAAAEEEEEEEEDGVVVAALLLLPLLVAAAAAVVQELL